MIIMSYYSGYGHRSRARKDHIPLWFYGVVLFFLLVVVPPIAGAMTSDHKAFGALEQVGYTNVELIDKEVYFIGFKGCGKSNSALFTMRGTDPIGKDRTVVVCAGVLKGGTLRC